MKPAEESAFIVLRPYDPAEGMSLKQAAARAGKSVSTVTGWMERYGLGRRVANGVWVVSKVALEMFLDGDEGALLLYHAQQFDAPEVRAYFARTGVPFRGSPEQLK